MADKYKRSIPFLESTVVTQTAGDVIEIQVVHTSGSDRTLRTRSKSFLE